MKKIALIACLFCFAIAYSQDTVNQDSPTSFKKWKLKFGLNMVNSSGLGSPFDSTSEAAFSNPFALGAEYSFNDEFAVSLFQSINKWKANEGTIDGISLTEDQSYFAIDVNMKFYFDEYLFNADWLDIYIEGGLGVVSERETGLSVNLGGGGIIWLSESVGLNLQSVGKFAGKDESPTNHFQYFAGIVFKFGGIDTDNDGIFDKEDECPNDFGLIEFNGCPDTDGDGVRESLDECPLAAGPGTLNGCPDKDGDGVANKNDECPEQKGTIRSRGCPDRDNDGVPDKYDRCPDFPGSFNNKGCPWKDTDKDGVLDKDDKCPNQIGPVNNNGCPYPKLSNVEVQKIDAYAKTILFDLGKADLKPGSKITLNSVVSIMKNYPNEKFHIAGHSDNSFTKEFNQTLSENRANNVKNYLISNGINANRLTSKGYGEDQPVQSNSTLEGKSKNRRVEILLIK